MKRFANLAWIFVLVTLAACAVFTSPKTLDQRIAAAYVTHTAVVEAAGTSLSLGDISSDQGQTILEIATRTKTILDGARLALGAGDVKTAEGQLALALGILAELQSHLRRQS